MSLVGKLESLPKTTPLFVLGAAIIPVFGLLIYMALLNKPIADDFGFWADPRIDNPLTFTAYFFLYATGRIAHGGLISVLHLIFGESSVVIAVILELLLLVMSIAWLLHLLIPRATSHRPAKLLIAALFLAVIPLLCMTSLFDSLFWLTSSTVYISSIISLTVSLCLLVTLCRSPGKRSKLALAGLCGFIVLSQTFSEPTAVCAILLYAALAYCYRESKHIKVIVSALAASIVGFLLVFLSPGSRLRQDRDKPHALDIASTLGRELHGFLQDIIGWRILVAVGLGLVLAILFGHIMRRQHKRLLLLGGAAIVIPTLVTFGIAVYSLGIVKLRVETIPVYGVIVGTALISAVIVSRTHIMKQRLIPLALACIVPLCLFAALPNLLSTSQAIALRKGLFEYREERIKLQVAQRDKIVHLDPAPILVSSQATEMSYEGKAPKWWLSSFTTYYHIEAPVKIIRSQPKGYCLSNPPVVNTFSIRSCPDIARKAR